MADDKKIVDENQTDSSEQVRTPRGQESREAEQAVQSWENPVNLPAPDPQPGWVFRWIRTSLLGNADTPNVSRRFREGWVACKAEDHPELKILQDYNSEWAKKGNIEVAGQLLCKIPEDLAKQRQEYFDKQAQSQIDTEDNACFKDNDPRMNKEVYERSSKTTFGRDN